MNKKAEQFIEQMNNFMSQGQVANEIQLIIKNAITRLEDKQLNVDEAKKYILDWVLKLKEKGQQFSEYEASLYDLVKAKAPKMNFSNSIARSIINIFR